MAVKDTKHSLSGSIGASKDLLRKHLPKMQNRLSMNGSIQRHPAYRICSKCKCEYHKFETGQCRCLKCGREPRYRIQVWDSKKGRPFKITTYRTKDGLVPLDSFETAQRALSSVRVLTDKQGFDIRDYNKSTILFRTIYDEFVKAKFEAAQKGDLSIGTAKFYKWSQRELTNYFANHSVREIDLETLDQFYNSLPSDRRPWNRHLMQTLVTFFRWCVEKNHISFSPTFPKMGKASPPKIDWSERDTQLRVLKKIPEFWKPLFMFGMNTGWRLGEIRALKSENVNLKQGLVKRSATFTGDDYRDTTKDNQHSVIPLSPDAIRALRTALKRKTEFVFTNPDCTPIKRQAIGRILDGACREAKVKRTTSHPFFRHSFISQAISANVPTRVVQELVGHKRLSTTERYSHLRPETMRAYFSNFLT